MPNYNLTPPEFKPKDLQRFLSRIPHLAIDVCWPWIGQLTDEGYGIFKLFGGGRTRTGRSRPIRVDMTHRVQFFLHTGEWPPVVRHTCDNPPCANPTHLLGGTQADNVEDCRVKGRIGFQKGVECYKAILNEDKVRFIRQNWLGNGGTLSLSQLGKMFGVAKPTISNITAKPPRSWKHVI